MKFLNRIFLQIFLLLALLTNVQAQQLQDVPRQNGKHLVDVAGSLTADQKSNIEELLVAISKEGHIHIAVIVVPTLGVESIEAFSMRVAEKWKPGEKGKNNGLLITVSTGDKKARVDTGRGLEGDLPDLLVRDIKDKHFYPSFNQEPSNLHQAIFETAHAFADTVAKRHEGEHHTDIANGVHEHGKTKLRDSVPFADKLPDGAIFIAVLFGLVGGIFLLIGIHGESGGAIGIGLGISTIVPLVVGAILFFTKCLLIALSAFCFAIIVALGLGVGGAVLSTGGDFAGGGN